MRALVVNLSGISVQTHQHVDEDKRFVTSAVLYVRERIVEDVELVDKYKCEKKPFVSLKNYCIIQYLRHLFAQPRRLSTNLIRRSNVIFGVTL